MRRISRRTVLQGLGTTLALPMLEVMRPLARAADANPAAPKRLAFFFVPNGAHMADWTPKKEGADFDLPRTLEPLAKVKGSINILSGLAHDKARANGDGPGDHARSCAAFLTGCQPYKTPGANLKLGISADQIAANQIGKLTRLPSLELGIEPGMQSGNCDSGYSCAYSANISWRSAATPMAKEINPRLVFDRLFSNHVAGEAEESRLRRERQEKSILDFVLEDATGLRRRLGGADQRKLDEYLTSVRELERRLGAADVTPAADLADFRRPKGIPDDYAEHLRLMTDVLALAFRADLTRVATFMLANEGSNRSYRNIEVREGHHDLSHHGNDKAKQAKIQKINRFHMEVFARFLETLQATREGEGTLLDNSMIVYGSGIGDGNAHNHDNLPVLLAGKGNGSIRAGRHLKFPENTPMANLFLSLLERMDVRAEALGDSTGRLEGLG